MVGHYHPTPCQTGQLGGLHQPGLSQSPRPPNGLQALGRPEGTQDMDNLVLKVLEIRRYRQEMHQLQEEVNWERQNDSMSSASSSLNESLFNITTPCPVRTL